MSSNNNNYFVCTSIPYVNGEPHLGHAMEFVMADVLARYARQNGKKVIFSTGTDEHGGKIAEKAEELGLTPQKFADINKIDLGLNIAELTKSYEESWKIFNVYH